MMAILLSLLMPIIRGNCLKLKKNITGQTGNDGTKDVKIMVPFKNRCNFENP